MLRDEFIASRDGESPWLTEAYVRTVREIEHQNVVSCAIVRDDFPDKYPHE